MVSWLWRFEANRVVTLQNGLSQQVSYPLKSSIRLNELETHAMHGLLFKNDSKEKIIIIGECINDRKKNQVKSRRKKEEGVL